MSSLDRSRLAIARRARCSPRVVAHGAWRRRRAGAARTAPAGASRRRRSASAPALRDEPALGTERHDAAGRRRPPAPARCARRERAPLQLDALIDAIAPIDARGAGHRRRRRSPHLPPTRRVGSKPFVDRRPERRDRRVGGAGAGPALRRVPGRRAAGQPHRRAQRDRVLRVRAEACRPSPRRSARRADFPDMLDVVARARELDAFAERSTMRSSRCTCTRAARPGASATSSSMRARHGFVPGVVPGRLVLPSARGGRAAGAGADLRLAGRARRRARPRRGARRDARASTCRRPTRSVEPFEAWQAAAQALAVGMDADDRRRRRPAAQRARLRRRSAPSSASSTTALEARDLAAGIAGGAAAVQLSVAARRRRARRRAGDRSPREPPRSARAAARAEPARELRDTPTATTCSTRRRSRTPSTTSCSRSCRRSRPSTPSC